MTIVLMKGRRDDRDAIDNLLIHQKCLELSKVTIK